MAAETAHAPSALLLLSAPSSSSPSLQIFKEAFEPALSAVFAHLNDRLKGSTGIQSAGAIARLDVAVSIPGLFSSSRVPRARIFGPLQQLLAGIYKLVGAVSATRKIELDAPGGIDVRVVFSYDHRDSTTTNTTTTPTTSSGHDFGPVLELRTLALSGRAWDVISHVETKEGKDLIAAFAANLDHAPTTILAVPGGATSDSSGSGALRPSPEGPTSSVPHYSVAVGGTFDHLHIGHKLLLTATALALDSPPPTAAGEGAAFSSATKKTKCLVTVGVTGDELLLKKKYAEYLESWDTRSENTLSFLTSIIDFSPSSTTTETENNTHHGFENRKKYILHQVHPDLDFAVKIVQISDPFGPTITDEAISALVVSKETRSGGEAVNEERKKKGWQVLDVFEVDVLNAGEVVEAFLEPTGKVQKGGEEGEGGRVDKESFESKISSTDIRRRRMQREQGHDEQR